jgi:hypothetical protein
MPDNDQLTDSGELHRLIDSLSDVTVPAAPSLDAIVARGRARRRHRRYGITGLFVIGACIAAGLAISPLGAPAATPTAAPGGGRTLSAIRTAAYSIVFNSDGTATLSIDPNELFDPSKLQSDLDRFGIPAHVTVGSFCTSDPAPAGLSQAVSSEPNEQRTISIDPTAIPTGTELSVGEFELPMSVQMATYTLIDKDSYTCSNSPPTSSPIGGGLYRMGAWLRRP